MGRRRRSKPSERDLRPLTRGVDDDVDDGIDDEEDALDAEG